jgi:hypothetical protein
MARGKRYQPEQVVKLLRQIEVAVANGKTTAQACKEAATRESGSVASFNCRQFCCRASVVVS